MKNTQEHLAESEPKLVSVGRDPEGAAHLIFRGEVYDQPGQIFNFQIQKYNGMDYIGNGQVAAVTESGNVYLVRAGYVLNLKETLKKGQVAGGRYKFGSTPPNLEVGKPWPWDGGHTTPIRKIVADTAKWVTKEYFPDPENIPTDDTFTQVFKALERAGIEPPTDSE